MDLGTLIGLVSGVAAIMISVIIEGGKEGPAVLLRLFNAPAALIVFGGTFGATTICFKLKDILGLGKYFGVAFSENKQDVVALIEDIVRYAEAARKEGLLKLEELLVDVKNSFLKKGIQLVVDGTDPTLVREILEIETAYMEERHHTAANIFQQAGGFAPTMGIIGTVMGLVNVLANLSDAASLGPAISSAFIATFYGIFFANILFLPLSNKLKYKSKEEVVARQITIEGILSIQAGEHPRVISEKLMSFLAPAERANSAAAGGKSVEG